MDVLSNIKNLSKIEDLQRASSKGINWARSGGESSFISGSLLYRCGWYSKCHSSFGANRAGQVRLCRFLKGLLVAVDV